MDSSLCDGTVNSTNLTAAFDNLGVKCSKDDKELLLEDAHRVLGEDVSVGAFARYLKIKDGPVDIIPLHDARAANISRLKTKIQSIDKTCNSPRILERVNTLTQSLSLGRSGSVDTLRPRTSSNLSSMHVTSGEFNPQGGKSQHADLSGPPVSSVNMSEMPTFSTSPMRYQRSLPALDVTSPMKSSQALPPPDFSPNLSSAGSMNSTTKPKKKATRMRDPVEALTRELEYSKTPRREGTKREPMTITDWSRVGVGGDGVNPSTGLYNPPAEQYVTASMAKFPPMQFHPGIGVTRDGCIGDAEKLYLEREHKRNARYARTAANMQITKDRLELEELTEAITDLRKTQKSASGMLQYNSNVFLRDMKELKKQPLQCMQKKPNPKQFKLMWSGTFHPAHSTTSNGALDYTVKESIQEESFADILRDDVEESHCLAEDRDFTTVYSSTFSRSILRNGSNAASTTNMHNRPGTSIY